EIFLLTIDDGDVERVEVDGEGDDEGVETDGDGDLKKLESGGEGDVGEVQANREGVSTTGIEVDEYIGMGSGGHISLRSTVGEDNDSEVAADEYAGDFATSDGVNNVADEYVGDFATSDGVDNVAAASSGEEEDGNETERIRASYSPVAKCLQIKMFQDKHHCSVSFKNKMVTSAMIAQHFEATIKDHLKMKLRETQRRCASKMYVNVTIHYCYRVKKIVKEKMAGNHKEKFGLIWDYAHEL
ncbi:hypothetical protein Gogos_021314, partial [Gossypium gossypioides]|nr:hypothetical protein [Gossypium gossypioides]